MKTVNVLTRKMGDFNVFQRTSDGYFDANSLLKLVVELRNLLVLYLKMKAIGEKSTLVIIN